MKKTNIAYMSHTFLCIRAIPGDTGSVPYEGG